MGEDKTGHSREIPKTGTLCPEGAAVAVSTGPACLNSGCAAHELFGIAINSVSLEEAFAAIDRKVASGEPGFIVTPNVDHLCLLRSHSEFRKTYEDAFLVLPDGVPLIWGSRLLGKPLKRKISGSDLVYWLSEHAAKQGHRLFLLGGQAGAAEEAGRLLARRYPGLNVVGHCCPDHGFEKDPATNAEVIECVRRAAPDLCYVALGSPKQDVWTWRHCMQAGVPVMIGVGASLDFVTGKVRRAPVWMQRCGLEWLWRLVQEPRRLWRRYLIRDSYFLWLLLIEFARTHVPFFWKRQGG